jgi:hypothetical protein
MMGSDLEARQTASALCPIMQLPPLGRVGERDLVEPPLLTKQPFPFR